MKTVAIVGSCVSRDNFNSHFNEQYSNNFKVLSYYHQMSIISLMSREIKFDMEYFKEDVLSLTNYEHLYNELIMTALITLENNKPDIIILDFLADAQFGIIELEDSYITNKIYRFSEAGIIDTLKVGNAISFDIDYNLYFEIWKTYFDEFMIFIKKNLPGTKLILNSIKSTNELLYLESNEIKIYKPEINSQKINIFWSMMDEYASNVWGIEKLIFQDKYYLDPNYIFGLGRGLVHFHKNYYENFYEKFINISDHSNSEKNIDVPHINNNLIYNANFVSEKKYWFYWDDRFKIMNNIGFKSIKILDNYNIDNKRPQLWSNSIEINADGEDEYELSFLFKTKYDTEIPSPGVIFTIRTYKHISHLKHNKSIENFKINVYNQYEKIGSWRKYYLRFKPRGKYMKAGPFLFGVCDAEYAGIKLIRIR